MSVDDMEALRKQIGRVTAALLREDSHRAETLFRAASGLCIAARAVVDAPPATCATCRHLTPFELARELSICPIVNIRIHTDSAAIFGCNQHEVRPTEGHNG